jgi:hypothetical protein
LSSPCIPSLILCITCLVPALYPLLSCIPCLGSAPQYILCACSVHSFPVCITSTSILASLRCTCFVIARQILSTPCRHSGQTPHRPRRTLRPTDRNTGNEDRNSDIWVHESSKVEKLRGQRTTDSSSGGLRPCCSACPAKILRATGSLFPKNLSWIFCFDNSVFSGTSCLERY